MNKNSTIFDRILFIIDKKGLKNVAALAIFLGYGSPQKIYRLKQEENSKPSFDMIVDFSNKFEDLNLRWFITGEGEPFELLAKPGINYAVAEPHTAYATARELTDLKNKIKELEIEKNSLLLALRQIGTGNAQPGLPSKKQKTGN